MKLLKEYKREFILSGIAICIFAFVKYKDYSNKIVLDKEHEKIIQVSLQIDSIVNINSALKEKVSIDSMYIIEQDLKMDSIVKQVNFYKNEITATKKNLSNVSKKFDYTDFDDDLRFINSIISRY